MTIAERIKAASEQLAVAIAERTVYAEHVRAKLGKTCSECGRPRSGNPDSEEGMSGMCLQCLNGQIERLHSTAAGRGAASQHSLQLTGKTYVPPRVVLGGAQRAILGELFPPAPPPTGRKLTRQWLGDRVSNTRTRVALWIAPWLDSEF